MLRRRRERKRVLTELKEAKRKLQAKERRNRKKKKKKKATESQIRYTDRVYIPKNRAAAGQPQQQEAIQGAQPPVQASVATPQQPSTDGHAQIVDQHSEKGKGNRRKRGQKPKNNEPKGEGNGLRKDAENKNWKPRNVPTQMAAVDAGSTPVQVQPQEQKGNKGGRGNQTKSGGRGRGKGKDSKPNSDRQHSYQVASISLIKLLESHYIDF